MSFEGIRNAYGQATETTSHLVDEFLDSAPGRFIADNKKLVATGVAIVASIGAYRLGRGVAERMAGASQALHLGEGLLDMSIADEGLGTARGAGANYEQSLTELFPPVTDGLVAQFPHHPSVPTVEAPLVTDTTAQMGQEAGPLRVYTNPSPPAERTERTAPAFEVINNPDSDLVALLDAAKAPLTGGIFAHLGPTMVGKTNSRSLVAQMFANIDRADALSEAGARPNPAGYVGYSDDAFSTAARDRHAPIVTDDGILDRDYLAKLEARVEDERANTPLTRYEGAPLPVDFDEQGLMRRREFVTSLSIDRPDIRFAVVGGSVDGPYGAGLLSYHNNIFSARHNANLAGVEVVETQYRGTEIVVDHSTKNKINSLLTSALDNPIHDE